MAKMIQKLLDPNDFKRKNGFPLLPVWPIDSEEDSLRTREAADRLITRDDLTKGEQAALDVQLTLMDAYEEEHVAIETRSIPPLDMLRFLMEEHGMTASDLGRLLGQRTLGSAILNRRRDLSKSHIKILADHFGVSTDLFL